MAADFVLQDNKLADQTLATFADTVKLIYSVPSLDTMVCAETAKQLDELAQQNPQIQFIVVSTDLPFAQQRFCKQNKLKQNKELS